MEILMRSPVPKMIRSQKAALSLIAALVVGLAAITSVIVYQRYRVASQKINYSQLYQLAESATAVSLTIEGATLIVQARDGSLLQATVTSEPAQQAVVELFRKNNVPIEFRALQPGPLITALNWLMPLLIFALAGLVGWRVYRNMNGGDGSFSCVDSSNKQDATFAEVAGVDEARAELAETIEFLRDPSRFGRLGGRAPRGILLFGPPGTGKTLLARAAAGEAGVPFLSASGSSFQEKFAGVGAAPVRRLFAEGK